MKQKEQKGNFPFVSVLASGIFQRQMAFKTVFLREMQILLGAETKVGGVGTFVESW